MSVQQFSTVPSPNSGATTPTSSKYHKSEAKKAFKYETDTISDAIKLLDVYHKAFLNFPKGLKAPLNYYDDVNNVNITFQVDSTYPKQFTKSIIRRVNELHFKATAINKTTRSSGSNLGFLAPAEYSDELVNFFAQATLGPIVQSDFTIKESKSGKRKRVPTAPYNVTANSFINTVMYFTQPNIDGQPNPLFKIISHGTLTPLFSLHTYHTSMQKTSDSARLSASAEMRNLLYNLMVLTIQTDVRKLSEAVLTKLGNRQLAESIVSVRDSLIASIRDPNLVVKSRWIMKFPEDEQEKGYEVFNPNNFIYAHFLKLISNAKVVQNRDLFEQKLVAVRQTIPAIYSRRVNMADFEAIQRETKQGEQPKFEVAVIKLQQDFATSAISYKQKKHKEAIAAQAKLDKRRGVA